MEMPRCALHCGRPVENTLPPWAVACRSCARTWPLIEAYKRERYMDPRLATREVAQFPLVLRMTPDGVLNEIEHERGPYAYADQLNIGTQAQLETERSKLFEKINTTRLELFDAKQQAKHALEGGVMMAQEIKQLRDNLGRVIGTVAFMALANCVAAIYFLSHLRCLQ